MAHAQGSGSEVNLTRCTEASSDRKRTRVQSDMRSGFSHVGQIPVCLAVVVLGLSDRILKLGSALSFLWLAG